MGFNRHKMEDQRHDAPEAANSARDNRALGFNPAADGPFDLGGSVNKPPGVAKDQYC
jgi:hypothetical protein